VVVDDATVGPDRRVVNETAVGLDVRFDGPSGPVIAVLDGYCDEFQAEPVVGIVSGKVWDNYSREDDNVMTSQTW
jgi:hypothetical protein